MFLTPRALIRGRVFHHSAQAEFFTMRSIFHHNSVELFFTPSASEAIKSSLLFGIGFSSINRCYQHVSDAIA